MMLCKFKLERGVIWNLLGGAVPALVALVSISTLVILLSSETFVFVSLMLSICLFLQVYDFGFSRTLHYFKSLHADESDAKRFLDNARWLSFVVGCVVTLLLWFLMPSFVEHWLVTQSDSSEQAARAFQLTSLAVLPSVMMHVYKGYMEAEGAFKAVNISKIIAIVSLFAGTMTTLLFTESMVKVAIVLVLSRYLSLYVYILLASKPLPRLSSLPNIDWTIAKQLSSYIAMAGFVGLVSAGFIYGDRFFVAGFIDATDYSIYVVSQDYLSRFLLLPWSLAMVLIPVINSASKNRYQKLVKFRTAYKQITWLSGLFVFFSVTVVIGVLPLLISPSLVEQSQVIALIIMVGVLFGAYAQVPFIGLFTLGKAKLLCWVFALELLLYFCLAPLILSHWEGLGAASLWSGRLILEAVLLNYFFYNAIK